MPIATPRRMLLAGRHSTRLAADLATALPELETRTTPHGPLTAEDAAWADGYTGYTLPPNLADSGVRWVHLPMAGVDHVAGRLTGSDVVLTRTIGDMPRSIGSYVLTHLLADAWQLREYDAQQARGQWQQREPAPIDGRSVVVLGTGQIGAGVSRALRAGGYRTIGVNTRGGTSPDFDEVLALDAAATALGSCTALVNALPLTDATRGLVDASMLRRLSGAVVVNVGRGATVVSEDLRAALETGHVRRAVLDVVETEPLPAEDWRWTHPDVTLTPHVSGPTRHEDVVAAIVAAYRALAAGQRPPHTLDQDRGY